MNVYIKKQHFALQKTLVSVAVITASLVFLNLFQGQVRNSFLYASAPVSKVLLQSGKTTSEFFGSFFAFTAVKMENNNLKTENQNLLASLSVLQETIQASQDLTVALQNTKEHGFSLLQAKIIGLDGANDTVTIDKGADNGIGENMAVISAQKVLFGRVVKVYPGFSQIMLISNKKSALAVKIQAQDVAVSQVYGAIKGSGNLSIYMDLINSDSKVNQGDVLVTSAQEGIFPKDLLVGKVESANTNDAGAFQTASIQPFFDPKNIDNLFIITNYPAK